MSSSSLNDLCKDFDHFLEQFPGMQRELVEMAGEKLHEKVLQNIDTSTKEQTGRMKAACRMVIGSGGGYAAVRNDYKKAKHTHLVEFGHRLMKGAKTKEGKHGQRVNIKGSGKQIGWVNGKFMYRNALNELEDELVADAEKMIDKLVGDLF